MNNDIYDSDVPLYDWCSDEEPPSDMIDEWLVISSDAKVAKTIKRLGTGYDKPGIGDEILVRWETVDSSTSIELQEKGGENASGRRYNISMKMKEPIMLRIGHNNVLPYACELALRTMRKGEIAEVECHEYYAQILEDSYRRSETEKRRSIPYSMVHQEKVKARKKALFHRMKRRNEAPQQTSELPVPPSPPSPQSASSPSSSPVPPSASPPSPSPVPPSEFTQEVDRNDFTRKFLVQLESFLHIYALTEDNTIFKKIKKNGVGSTGPKYADLVTFKIARGRHATVDWGETEDKEEEIKEEEKEKEKENQITPEKQVDFTNENENKCSKYETITCLLIKEELIYVGLLDVLKSMKKKEEAEVTLKGAAARSFCDNQNENSAKHPEEEEVVFQIKLTNFYQRDKLQIPSLCSLDKTIGWVYVSELVAPASGSMRQVAVQDGCKVLVSISFEKLLEDQNGNLSHTKFFPFKPYGLVTAGVAKSAFSSSTSGTSPSSASSSSSSSSSACTCSNTAACESHVANGNKNDEDMHVTNNVNSVENNKAKDRLYVQWTVGRHAVPDWLEQVLRNMRVKQHVNVYTNTNLFFHRHSSTPESSNKDAYDEDAIIEYDEGELYAQHLNKIRAYAYRQNKRSDEQEDSHGSHNDCRTNNSNDADINHQTNCLHREDHQIPSWELQLREVAKVQPWEGLWIYEGRDNEDICTQYSSLVHNEMLKIFSSKEQEEDEKEVKRIFGEDNVERQEENSFVTEKEKNYTNEYLSLVQWSRNACRHLDDTLKEEEKNDEQEKEEKNEEEEEDEEEEEKKKERECAEEHKQKEDTKEKERDEKKKKKDKHKKKSNAKQEKKAKPSIRVTVKLIQIVTREKEQWSMSVNERLKNIDRMRRLGNKLMHRGWYAAALNTYTKAFDICRFLDMYRQMSTGALDRQSTAEKMNDETAKNAENEQRDKTTDDSEEKKKHANGKPCNIPNSLSSSQQTDTQQKYKSPYERKPLAKHAKSYIVPYEKDINAGPPPPCEESDNRNIAENNQHDSHTHGEKFLQEKRNIFLSVHLNLSLCYLKLKSYTECIQHCDKALALDESCSKAYDRKAKAFTAQGEFESAACTLQEALVHNPNNALFKNALREARQKVSQQRQKEKQLFAGFFSRKR